MLGRASVFFRKGHASKAIRFTFSILCITVQLLQFKPTAAHNIFEVLYYYKRLLASLCFGMYFSILREHKYHIKELLKFFIACS